MFVDTRHPATRAEWLALMNNHIQRFKRKDFAERRKAHEAWWSERWNRSWIRAEKAAPATDGDKIPDNNHAVRIGMDQQGHHKLVAEFGRVSVIRRALTAKQIKTLASRPHDQPAHLKDALYTTADPSPGPIANSADWAFPGGMTLEAWVKPDQNGVGNNRIIDKISPGENDGFLFDTHEGLRLIAGPKKLSTNNSLPTGEWSHLAAVVPAGDGSLQIYLDGRLVASSGSIDNAQLVSRAYTLQRFIDICGGRGAYPIKFNGSIFTVAHDGKPGNADYRRWGPAYWWQNTRLPYYSMCASGDTDLMKPLFDQYIKRFLPRYRYRTRHYFGHGGAFYSEIVHFWGDVPNRTYGWTPMEQREDPLQKSRWHKWEWVAGPEVVYMGLNYYDHTGDNTFLKRKLIPAANAVITFFEEHYDVNDQDKLVMHPSQACETWWECTNPMPELAGLHAIVARLLALDESLTTPEQRSAWTAFRRKLPDLPTRNVDGETAFAPAEKFAKKKNIENPELYNVFPFRLASFNRPNARLAVNALDHRWNQGNYGWHQDEIFMAYLGLTDRARKNLVGRAKNNHNGSRFPAFWGPNHDWVPDQTHGGVLMKAFQSMLMQTEPNTGSRYDGKIYLLPAWPENWNVDFKLHAPRQTVIKGVYRDGEMVRLDVSPQSRHQDVVIVD